MPTRLAVVILLAATVTRAATGQDSVRSRVAVDPTVAETPGVEPQADAGDGSSRRAGRGITPFVAPIPFKNTQIGWGLALLVGGIHRFDPDTAIKPSTGAIGGFYSENGSWGLIALEMARLGHDAWRLRGLLTHAEVRYDFYGIGESAGQAGRSVGIAQDMDFAAASALRRVVPGLYLGPQLLWIHTTAQLRDTAGLGLPPSQEDLATTSLFAPGVQAEFDSREDDYWPTRGSLVRVKALFFSAAQGESRAFQRYQVAWSWYGRLRGERLVLAANLNLCGADGDTPFYLLCSIGAGRNGLRGYTQGRYRDNVMTTAQAELRYHTAGRFGATIFGGYGQVAPSLSDVSDAELLPAGGLGVRYRLTRDYPMHLRCDYAWGKDGGILYFSASEAF